jgi:hypothetical protein
MFQWWFELLYMANSLRVEYQPFSGLQEIDQQ